MKPYRKKLNPPAKSARKVPQGDHPKGVRVDLKAVCSIDHECVGFSEVTGCCCASYDVTVTNAELKRIIPVLPEAAKLCPNLKTKTGYANVFEEAEKGLHSIDTREDGLCVFAYKEKGLFRCSLHKVETILGLTPGSVKPGVCQLWPLTFSDKGGVLTLHDKALSCACSSPRKKPSRVISPALLETIKRFGGVV